MKKMILIGFLTFVLMLGAVSAGKLPECPAGSHWAAGDAESFANSVAATGGTVTSGNNAIGMNDSNYAYISSTDPDSFVVLDMGEEEEIRDVYGADFQVYFDDTEESSIEIAVSNSPNSGFWEVGETTSGQGVYNAYLDWSPYAHSGIRYVKITNADNSRVAEVDAVMGNCISDERECGNGIREFTEECDDGNNINGDGCSAECTREGGNPYCGDGVKAKDEECDDGNNKDGDGCSSTCTIETPSNNVPEFTAIGAGLVLLGAGLMIERKRK